MGVSDISVYEHIIYVFMLRRWCPKKKRKKVGGKKRSQRKEDHLIESLEVVRAVAQTEELLDHYVFYLIM